MDNIVRKPWGFEFQFHTTKTCSIWVLIIYSGETTSMHVHKYKKASILAVSGKTQLNFIGNTNTLLAGETVVVRSGLFHQIEALESEHGFSILVEVENSDKRDDILRLKDNYGRAHKKYEWHRDDEASSKDIESLGIVVNNKKSLAIRGSTILELVMFDKVASISNNKNYIITEGGLSDSCGTFVAQSGDMITGSTLIELTKRFTLYPTKAYVF